MLSIRCTKIHRFSSCQCQLDVLSIIENLFDAICIMLFNAIKLNCRHLHAFRKYSSKSNAQHVRKSLSSENIRNIFLDYFTTKQHHQFIRSSSVVPYCDPTVPFVNAGMNQVRFSISSNSVDYHLAEKSIPLLLF